MVDSVSVLAAFGAGLLSFVTPCYLALVPAYLAYLGGFSLSTADGPAVGPAKGALLINIVAFALGFTAVFVLLGASLGALSEALNSFGEWLNRVSGIFIITLGLVSVGLLRLSFLERGYGPRVAISGRFRYFGSVLVGATLAFGWTPCVGPVLGGIFVLAGTSG